MTGGAAWAWGWEEAWLRETLPRVGQRQPSRSCLWFLYFQRPCPETGVSGKAQACPDALDTLKAACCRELSPGGMPRCVGHPEGCVLSGAVARNLATAPEPWPWHCPKCQSPSTMSCLWASWPHRTSGPLLLPMTLRVLEDLYHRSSMFTFSCHWQCTQTALVGLPPSKAALSAIMAAS